MRSQLNTTHYSNKTAPLNAHENTFVTSASALAVRGTELHSKEMAKSKLPTS
jgi:hypothetical protein